MLRWVHVPVSEDITSYGVCLIDFVLGIDLEYVCDIVVAETLRLDLRSRRNRLEVGCAWVLSHSG